MTARDDGRPARLKLIGTAQLGVESASAIAPLGEGLALVVDDDEGIFLADSAGRATLLRGKEDARGLGDLEGLCLGDEGATVYAVSEKKGEVFSLPLRRGEGKVTLGDPSLLGRLARPGDGKNKGWEGAAWLPPSASPGGVACLVAVHEAKPMALGLFTLPDLRALRLIELDGPFEEWMRDASDVAVCPVTGHLFLLSDRSQRIVEARLVDGATRLEAIGAFDLELAPEEKPEGIAFESDSRLVVVTDDQGRLLRYSVTR